MALRRGFTLVEILVTIGIIVVLIGLLVVAAGGARQGAMRSTTGMRMTAMSQATTRFEADTGYLPPLLDNDRAGIPAVEPTRLSGAGGYPKYLEVIQGRYSYTTPAEYLLGYGGVEDDGYEGLGLRRPGQDGWWDASLNDVGTAGRPELSDRRPRQDGPRGAVIGPYLELDDPDMLGALGWDVDAGQWDGSIDPATGQPAVYFPGDANFRFEAPKVIVDAWGTPIRYYRVNHPPGQPRVQYPADYQPPQADTGTVWRYTPSLSEVFALRPWEIEPGESVNYWFTDSSGVKWGDFGPLGAGTELLGDPSTTSSLTASRFGFLSAGANRRVYDWARRDEPGESISSLRNWLGDHAEGGNEGWYDDGVSVQWLGRPRSSQLVTVTEEANADNIVELGQ